jgi:hypothetical protein
MWLRPRAGSAAGFDNPTGVALGGSTLYVADTLNSALRTVDVTSGVTATLSGALGYGYADGAASAARWHLPSGVAVDATPTLYVADSLNNLVRKVTGLGTANVTVATLAGGGSAGGTAAGFADAFARLRQQEAGCKRRIKRERHAAERVMRPLELLKDGGQHVVGDLAADRRRHEPEPFADDVADGPDPAEAVQTHATTTEPDSVINCVEVTTTSEARPLSRTAAPLIPEIGAMAASIWRMDSR